MKLWLRVLIVMTAGMVTLGGITRLTGSGLSITEWKPIMGAIPPLGDSEWQEAFSKYQQIPQFKVLNSAMTLGEFKWIFFWEYTHRLWGRLIGLVFALPLLVFWLRRQIPRGYGRALLGILALGGAQGLMGWIMVKSGLSELTYVSHYRLAAHLILAFVLASALTWVATRLRLEGRAPEKGLGGPRERAGLRRLLQLLVPLVVLQTVYGAFVAGLKAGYQFNTFPTFHGKWFPEGGWEQTPWILNFLANPMTVQWVHRVLGSLILGGLAWSWWRLGRPRAVTHVLGVVGLQFALGASAVLWGMPLALAAAHQLVGLLLWTSLASLACRLKLAGMKLTES